ncbi:DNA circularization protein [Serratia sp. JSRIV006]|uniref:DNA circularization protein n=1 Tax=Serratia sp. JSRIV006 TaxID=2831896 RepID=UPI001CBDE187|nr:DNA circularization N-terminal domain-containing protein [Serratia sp. JSRIV006]UAN61535.1 DNA circularization protein [Serratia sp. JSRIV006]
MALITDALSSLLGSGQKWNWQAHIHPASFRGVPFAIVSGEGVFGRRQAVHEYPYRNTAWVEDLGRGTRKLTLRGFIVQDSLVYDAPDVMTQRDSLVAACEMEGAGILVHPTLGELTVSIPDGGLRVQDSMETGRAFEFTLTVIESGLKVFSITGNTAASSTVNANWLRTAATSAVKFIATVRSELRTVTQAIKTLKNTAAFWGGFVRGTTNEVTNLSNVLKSTFGSARYGRYNKGTVGGSVSGLTGVVTRKEDTNDYAGLVQIKMAEAVTGRAKLLAEVDALENINSIEAFSDGVRAIVDQIIFLSGSIEEKIRMLETLAAFRNNTFYSTDSDSAISNSATILICTLSAGAMAVVAVDYEPDSYDDAIAMLNRVCDTLDNVLLTVADSGNDESYLSLLRTRDALVNAFTVKGAQLSSLTQVSMPASLPALTLANRLYQDGARADELIQAVQPRHPAFMPLTFRALRK